MKTFKAIALDLDGTLTNSQKVITPKTKQALLDVQNKGVKLVLASGRPTYGIVDLAKDLQMDKTNGYILAYNGGMISQFSRNSKDEAVLNTVEQKTLPLDVIGGIYDYTIENNLLIISYEGDSIICETDDTDNNEYLHKESFINKMPIKKVQNFKEYVTFPVVKCLILGTPEQIAQAEEDLIKIHGSRLNIFRSEPYFLEICHPEIDKAQSLARLIEKLGIKQEELMAFGDGYNDVSMVNYAGMGVAMKNAQDACKAVADYITLSNDEDGIAYALEQLM